MTNPVPKWIMLSYSSLWNHFKDKEFDHESSAKVIENKQMVSIVLSKLRKAGWLSIKLDPVDSRKRIYKLNNPTKVMEEMMEVNK